MYYRNFNVGIKRSILKNYVHDLARILGHQRTKDVLLLLSLFTLNNNVTIIVVVVIIFVVMIVIIIIIRLNYSQNGSCVPP